MRGCLRVSASACVLENNFTWLFYHLLLFPLSLCSNLKFCVWSGVRIRHDQHIGNQWNGREAHSRILSWNCKFTFSLHVRWQKELFLCSIYTGSTSLLTAKNWKYSVLLFLLQLGIWSKMQKKCLLTQIFIIDKVHSKRHLYWNKIKQSS